MSLYIPLGRVKIKQSSSIVFSVSSLVFSPIRRKNHLYSKEIWPFELYVIRMIYKKAYLVVFLSQIIIYKRYVNIRIKF